jgi:hypothetical protein
MQERQKQYIERLTYRKSKREAKEKALREQQIQEEKEKLERVIHCPPPKGFDRLTKAAEEREKMVSSTSTKLE